MTNFTYTGGQWVSQGVIQNNPTQYSGNYSFVPSNQAQGGAAGFQAAVTEQAAANQQGEGGPLTQAQMEANIQRTVANQALINAGYAPGPGGWVNPNTGKSIGTTSQLIASGQISPSEIIQGNQAAMARQQAISQELGSGLAQKTAVANERSVIAQGLGLGAFDVPEDIYQGIVNSPFRKQRQREITASADIFGAGFISPKTSDTGKVVSSNLYSENLKNVSVSGGMVYIPDIGNLSYSAPIRVSQPESEDIGQIASRILDFGNAHAESVPLLVSEGQPFYSTASTTSARKGPYAPNPYLSNDEIAKLNQQGQVNYLNSIGYDSYLSSYSVKKDGQIWDVQVPVITGINKDKFLSVNPDVQRVIGEQRTLGMKATPMLVEAELPGVSPKKMVLFSTKRDYSILPQTPYERLDVETGTFEGMFKPVVASSFDSGIKSWILPNQPSSNIFINPAQPKPTIIGNTLADFTLGMPIMVGRETAKFKIGSWDRFFNTGVSLPTQAALEEFQASPQAQADYNALVGRQREAGRTETAINIAVVGAFEIGGAAIGAVKPKLNLQYSRSSFAKQSDGILVENGAINLMRPSRTGLFTDFSGDVLWSRPVATITRPMATKSITKLPASIPNAISGQRTFYEQELRIYPEGGSIDNPLTVKPLRRFFSQESYIQKGKPAEGWGEFSDLSTVNYPTVTMQGKNKVYEGILSVQGAASDARSVPIGQFGVGRIHKMGKIATTNIFTTESVIGRSNTLFDVGYVESNIPLYSPKDKVFAIARNKAGTPLATSEMFVQRGAYSPMAYEVPTTPISKIAKGPRQPVYPQAATFNLPQEASANIRTSETISTSLGRTYPVNLNDIFAPTKGGMAQAQVIRSAAGYDVPVSLRELVETVPARKIGVTSSDLAVNKMLSMGISANWAQSSAALRFDVPKERFVSVSAAALQPYQLTTQQTNQRQKITQQQGEAQTTLTSIFTQTKQNQNQRQNADVLQGIFSRTGQGTLQPTIQETLQVVPQAQLTKQPQITITKQPQVQIPPPTPSITIPRTPPPPTYVPPPTIITGGGWFDWPSGGAGGYKSKTSGMRKRYTPDLTASVFRVIMRGKAPRENVGFGVQPIFLPKLTRTARQPRRVIMPSQPKAKISNINMFRQAPVKAKSPFNFMQNIMRNSNNMFGKPKRRRKR